MSTRRQRQILRNRKLEFERRMDENIRKAKAMPEAPTEEEPEKKEEVKIVKKKKTTKKEDK